MMTAEIRFQNKKARWSRAHAAVGFKGSSSAGGINFLITNEALTELVDPDAGELDPASALDAFFKFERDIHRIAHKVVQNRPDLAQPIIINADDVRD